MQITEPGQCNIIEKILDENSNDDVHVVEDDVVVLATHDGDIKPDCLIYFLNAIQSSIMKCVMFENALAHADVNPAKAHTALT